MRWRADRLGLRSARCTLLVGAVAFAGPGCQCSDERDRPPAGTAGAGEGGDAGAAQGGASSGSAGRATNGGEFPIAGAGARAPITDGGDGGATPLAGAAGNPDAGMTAGGSSSGGSSSNAGGGVGGRIIEPEPCDDPGARECSGEQAIRACVDGFWREEECATRCAADACVAATHLALGHAHACAVLDDGTARCWGSGQFGKLGNGRTADRLAPEVVLDADRVSPLAHLSRLAAGAQHTCALLDDATVRCWGHNQFGQLGNLTHGAESLVPVAVQASAGVPLAPVAGLAAGGFQTCAVLSSGGARCWGKGVDGQLGAGKSGANGSSDAPVSVLTSTEPATELTGVEQISVGYWHACALTSARQVFCWGSNQLGQLGNAGLAGETRRPVAMPVLESMGGAPLSNVIQIASGYFHTCAVLMEGQVRCWGDGSSGQLGDGRLGTGVHAVEPVPVSSADGSGALGEVVEVAAGLAHTCARLKSGAVDCWGSARYGQLGDGRLAASVVAARPVSVLSYEPAGPLAGVVSLAAGLNHTCALTATNAVTCWGRNHVGQLTAKFDAPKARRFFWWEHD